jgi:polygalacturonase
MLPRVYLLLWGWGVGCFPAEAQLSAKDSEFTYRRAQEQMHAGWQRAARLAERIQPPTFPERTISVRTYGAVPDSTYDSHPAFAEAIRTCHAAGGGRVVVPAGTYLSNGPLRLLSNVNLHLEAGATILFGSDPADYTPLVKVRWEGTVAYNYSPLVYAYQQENVAISGRGTLDGQTEGTWSRWKRGNDGKNQEADKKVLREMGNDRVPDEQRVFGHGFLDQDGDGQDDGYGDGQKHYLRPTLVEFYECENVLIEGVTLKSSPFWTVHPVFCTNVTIRGLDIRAGTTNDDGIDPDSCTDVLIEDCTINTHDDAIAIKAGRDQDAWNRLPAENILIRNCTLASGVNAVCIGSEMSGGVRNVFVEKCELRDGKHALNFKTNLDRGGQVEQVYIRDIDVESCDEAMFIFRMDYHGYRGNNFPTRFNDFYVSNIRCARVAERPFKIVGVEAAPIRRVLLDSIQVEQAGAASQLEHTEGILTHQVTIGGEPFRAPK